MGVLPTICALIAVLVLVAVIVGVIVYKNKKSHAADRYKVPPRPFMPGQNSEVYSAKTDEKQTAWTLENPENPEVRFSRLRSRLARSGNLGRSLLGFFSGADLSESDWQQLEETLIMADLGVDAATSLIETLRLELKVRGSSEMADAKEILYKELLKLIEMPGSTSRALNLAQATDKDGKLLPAAILVVGVNGTGKTTTVGKLARVIVAEKKSVVLGAADTFRAAAAEQLTTWGQRVGVPVVASDKEGADPASVAYEAVKQAASQGAEVVMVDTAGRLQNKAGLMDELGKIKRVMEKIAPVNEVLLVLDATTGQNGLNQARVFGEVTGITGIVLTKLDGSAKGGIVLRVQQELGVPVKYVGLGEGPDDLAPFDPQQFVAAILD